jgi:hypothetical protein
MENSSHASLLLTDHNPQHCFCGAALESVRGQNGRIKRCPDCGKEMVIFVPRRGIVVMAEIPAGSRLNAHVNPDTEITREYARLNAETRNIRSLYDSPRAKAVNLILLGIMVSDFGLVTYRVLTHQAFHLAEVVFILILSILVGAGLINEAARATEIEERYIQSFVKAWQTRKWVYEEKLASLCGQRLSNFSQSDPQRIK